jgi:hypothetical protein
MVVEVVGFHGVIKAKQTQNGNAHHPPHPPLPAQRVYESGRLCAKVGAEAVIGKTDRGKKHRLYRRVLS